MAAASSTSVHVHFDYTDPQDSKALCPICRESFAPQPTTERKEGASECKAASTDEKIRIIAHESFSTPDNKIHEFHEPCIRNWLQINLSCPLCRAPVDTICNVTLGAINLAGPSAAYNYIGHYLVFSALHNYVDIINTLLRHFPISLENKETALFAAAQNGCAEVVYAFITNGGIPPGYIISMLSEAIRHGHTTVIHELITNGGASSDDKKFALSLAVATGNVAIVHELLTNGGIPPYDAWIALDAATMNDNIELMHEFLINGGISSEDKGQTLSIAVGRGCTATIDELITYGGISPEHKKSALMTAALHGYTAIVHNLIVSGISLEGKKSALRIAAEGGFAAIIDELLITKDGISSEDIVGALQAAIGNVEIVRILLATEGIAISDSDRYLLVSTAMTGRNNYPGVVQALVENVVIPEKDKIDMLMESINNNRLEITQILLRVFQIGRNQVIHSTLYQYANRPFFEIEVARVIQTLINVELFGAFSPEDRREAINYAIICDNKLAVQILLNHGPIISPEERGQAVIVAAENLHPAILRVLLEHRAEISLKDRGLAVRAAATRGCGEAVQILLENSVISPEDRKLSIIAAAEHGFKGVIQIFVNNIGISSEVKRLAISAARLHPEIQIFLQGCHCYDETCLLQ